MSREKHSIQVAATVAAIFVVIGGVYLAHFFLDAGYVDGKQLRFDAIQDRIKSASFNHGSYKISLEHSKRKYIFMTIGTDFESRSKTPYDVGGAGDSIFKLAGSDTITMITGNLKKYSWLLNTRMPIRGLLQLH